MEPKPCDHADLQLNVSSYAAEAGFCRPGPDKRRAATTPSGRAVTPSPKNDAESRPSLSLDFTFPGPLILPDDHLAVDPKDPPQSLRSWIREKVRNPFTQDRKTIYVAAAPVIPGLLSFMKSWTSPHPSIPENTGIQVQPPKTDDMLDYLAAFYHPLPVRLFPGPVSFVPWTAPVKGQNKPPHVGLHLGGANGSVTRIRTRPCPDARFGRQLNLNDILDAAIEALPADAYSLVLSIEHDMYEDEDDNFCCGRAYGGSRVAVVSAARYHPALDEEQGVDRAHMWPASHCKAYVDGLCGGEEKGKGKGRTKALKQRAGDIMTDAAEMPIAAAVRASLSIPDPKSDLYGLWFSRVARTFAHELGHCLCLDHCIYYACVMQGTMGMAEDVRQPPYLCPVCLSKVTRAVMEVADDVDEDELTLKRYAALMRFCERWLGVAMFACFHAWLGKRMQTLEGPRKPGASSGS